MVDNCVAASPCVRLTLQSNAGLVTSNAVSHMFVNSSSMYGTADVAPLSINVTKRFPESIIDPNVGQPDAVTGVVLGTNEMVSRPTALNTVSYRVGDRLLMLTMRRVRTSDGLASSQLFTIVR